MRTSLAAIERRISISQLRGSGTSSVALGEIDKMKRAGSNTFDRDVDDASLQSHSVYGMVEMLEEQSASLPLDGRLWYQLSRVQSRTKQPSKGQSDVDDVGIHQLARPPTPERKPCQRRVSSSSSSSCVSVEEPWSRRSPSVSMQQMKSGASRPSKMSLDHFQAEHDAVIIAPRGSTTMQLWPTTVGTSLPCLGWFLLLLCGILDVCQLPVIARIRLAIQSSLCGVLVLMSCLRQWAASHIEPSISTILYFSGSLLAVMSLRRNNIKSLIGEIGELDEYAERHGFCEEWKRLSQVRLMQTVCGFVLMIACRVSALFLANHGVYSKLLTLQEASVFDAIAMVAFTFMAASFCGACYCVLHITA